MISPNTQRSRFLTACRRLEKLVLTSAFLTEVFHPWWSETYRVIQEQFWTKVCDISGVETYSDPPTYFHGGHVLRPPNSQDLRLCSELKIPGSGSWSRSLPRWNALLLVRHSGHSTPRWQLLELSAKFVQYTCIYFIFIFIYFASKWAKH